MNKLYVVLLIVLITFVCAILYSTYDDHTKQSIKEPDRFTVVKDYDTIGCLPRVIHDNVLDVTCYQDANGISCLTDYEISLKDHIH